MCGIAGIIGKNKIPDRNIFNNMISSLKKRGPDYQGIYYDKNLIIGHRRLSIIDLSSYGNQPMLNEIENIAIAFNGEIYNYLDLKKELKNEHIWNSRTDTEVLLHAYEEYGEEVVKKIEGMFAFAIYDKNKNNIFFARDHFGKKPLYYYYDDEFFIFASELKAILLFPEIRKKIKIDENALIKFLFYGYIPSPDCILNNIKKLEPSTCFVFDISKWQIKNKYNYWNIEAIKEIKPGAETQVLENIKILIKDGVKKRLMSDVPLGVFLSGGVDSTVVTSFSKLFIDKLQTFTVAYKNSPEADESKYAKRVAEKLGVKYNLYYFEDETVNENFLNILNYLDEPIADAAVIPLYYIAKFAKNKITVALSGDGGDEIFGGYAKYIAQKKIEDFKYLFYILRFLKLFFNKTNSYYKLLDSVNLPFAVRQFIFGSGSFLVPEVLCLLKRDRLNIKEIFNDAEKYSSYFYGSNINRAIYLDCRIQLPDWYLVKADRATMAVSLEVRNPLLDRKLAEYMFSLPENFKIRNGETKYLLKKIAIDFVDRDIIYRKKSGFGVPLNKWIRKELKDIFYDYLFVKNDFFNIDYVKQIYNEHMSGKKDNRFKLLRIFNFNY